MPLRFNQLLVEAGIDPADVRLLRHQTNLGGGRSLIEAWRTDRAAFEDYQALQLTAKRSSFTRSYWAAFLGTWDGRTLFAGLYAASAPLTIDEPIDVPLTGTIAPAGTLDRFATTLTDCLADYAGRLYIEWGGGSVRRQNIWRNLRRRLAECRPRLGVDVRRRACGAASVDVRWSGV